MRVLFFLLMLLGLAAGFAYPSLVTVFGGSELGEIRVIGPGATADPEIYLTGPMAPVAFNLKVTPPEGVERPATNTPETAFSVVITRNGEDVHRSLETFRWTYSANEGSRTPTVTVQERRVAYLTSVAEGGYVVSVSAGQPADMPVKTVDLMIRQNALPVDERVQPIGLLVFAGGFVGFVVAMRRRRRDKTTPTPPGWGRGG